MTNTFEPLLNETDVANWLGVSLPTVQRMRSHGSGPFFIRISTRRIGYRKVDIERWLGTRTIERVDALVPSEGPRESVR